MPPKRRRRFQGLYYHSSPPKVLPMNGQIANNTGRRRRDPDDLSVKLSTIRIWMHEKDIGKLTRVLWAGQGNRLRQQASTNPKVKRFLAAVPYVMNSIKDVHQAVIDNSLENLQSNLEPPVPPALVTCRDANGLNLIHKAAGLGHATILEYLIQTWPDGVHETDITGKTPLHWAASAKNNMRCYTLLTQAGCDEEAVDYKMKTPSFYRHKPHEIERAFLTFVPEAPRVSPDIATDWEALSDESGDGKKLDIKIPEMNGFGRHSNAESNENTSEAEMTEAASGQEDEEMSKDGDAAEENAEADAESEPEEEKEPETKDENEGTEEPPAEEKENEKEDATETKEDEEKEKEEAKEKEEEKEEEKETQNETEEKEEEKPQDEKQQTETLNVTTANLTKASEEQQEEEKDQNKSNEGDNNTSHTEDDGDHKAATENEKMGEESKEGKEIKEQEIETTDEKSLEKEQNDKDKEPLDKGKIETKEDDNENVKETADDEKSIEKDNKESIKEKTNELDNEEKEKATPDEKTNQEDNDEKNKENLKENNKETVGEEIKTGDDEKSKENVEENKKEISGEEIKTSDENVKNEEEKNIKNSELKIEQDQSEENPNKSNDEEKDNDKDNEESKTLGETLVDIKDEVKENVKYLANSIKNVFSDKTPNKDEEDVKENSTPKADENKDNLEKVLDNEKSKEAEDKTSDKETDHKAPDNDKPLENGKLNETDENEDKNKQSPLKDIPDKSENIINNENPKEKTEENKETTVEPTTSNDKGPTSSEDDSNENAQTKIDDAIKANENSNISNEITKIPTPTSSPPRTAAKTPTKETPKKENDKTEEDENNNTNKLTNEIANSSTTTQKTETTASKPNTSETLIDDKLKELNKSLEEYQKEEEQALEKEEKDIGEKLEEMADNLKENVKDMADKVVNLFSTTKDATEKMENESSEVVVHTESPHKQTPSKKVVKDTESSDETADEDEEQRIQNIITSGDMEQLAQIVLNGDGQKLLNVEATEPEIQAFLKNVPNYMGKIKRVHEAARNGSLLNLQQALDRRKFAIAKDEISPNGATPLHVAVLFGNSDIVRYLSARFPETMTITDDDGRTPLHYASVINDNGHFYNVLLQLGANPKDVDKMGHTPEDYLSKEELKDILNYGQLLKRFGAEELEEQLLSDQVPDDLHSSRRLITDGDVARTLDRCFSVIQESSKIWSGQTASALSQRKPLSATNSIQLAVTSYLSRFLKASVYEKIKKRQTRLDHNLFDVIWPALRKTSKERNLEEDINCGIIAPDYDVYVVFQEFLVPLIKDMHCMSISADFKPHPRIAYFPMENGERLNTAYFVFDDESNLITRTIVECSRNLDKFELPLNLTIGQIEQAERLIMSKLFSTAFIEAIDEAEPGSYYTMSEILEDNSEIYEILNEYGLLIPLLDLKDCTQLAESTAFNGNLFPYGRGVYISSSNNLALWLNCQEHLRIIGTSTMKDGADIGAVYTRVGRAISFLEQQIHFKESYLLGYLQARPSYLGTGLKMTTILRLPNLMKEMDNLRHLCSVRGLYLTTNLNSKISVRLINMQSMGAVEHILFQDYCTAVTNILSLEKDMSLTNSKHIASMLVKIFRRKKTSLVDRD